MSKKVNKIEEEVVVEETTETEVTVVGKPKWSLKKKLMIGGGIFAGLVLGAIALGRKPSEDVEVPSVDDFEYDDEENYDITEEEVVENNEDNSDEETKE